MRANIGGANEHWGIFIKPASEGKALDFILIDGVAAKPGDLVTPPSGDEHKWQTGKSGEVYTKIGTATWKSESAYQDNLKKLKDITTETGRNDISTFTTLKCAI